MEAIIVKLQDALRAFNTARAETLNEKEKLTALTNSLEKEKAIVVEERSVLELKIKDLVKREAKIKKIENVVEATVESKKLIREADNKTARLEEVKSAFAKESAKERNVNEKQRIENQAETEGLIKAKKEFEKEKESYKDKVLAEIKKKVK